jgi:hypothetical protein
MKEELAAVEAAVKADPAHAEGLLRLANFRIDSGERRRPYSSSAARSMLSRKTRPRATAWGNSCRSLVKRKRRWRSIREATPAAHPLYNQSR